MSLPSTPGVEEGCRPATGDDLDVLVALADLAREELAAAERDGGVWRATSARRDPLRPRLAAELTDPLVDVVVGTLDGIAVGYGVAVLADRADDRPHGVVTDLFVVDEGRGIGVGAAMLAQLSDWCAAQGCAGIDALALPGARETKNFFETFGFVARAITVHHALPGPTPASVAPR